MFLILTSVFLIGLTIGKCSTQLSKILQIHNAISAGSSLSSWIKTAKTIYQIQSTRIYDEYVKKCKTSKFVNDKFEIEYYHKGRKYRMIVKENDKCESISVYSNGKDITKIFLEYLGPNCDFHNHTCEMTANHFAKGKIVIFDDDMNETVFEGNQKIKFPLGNSLQHDDLRHNP